MEIIFITFFGILLFYTGLWQILAPVFIVWLVAFFVSEKFSVSKVLASRIRKEKRMAEEECRIDFAVSHMPPCL